MLRLLGIDGLKETLERIENHLCELTRKVDQIMAFDQDLLTAAQAIEAELPGFDDSLNEIIILIKGLSAGTVVTAADVANLNAAVADLGSDKNAVVAAIAGLPTPITAAPASLALSLTTAPSGTVNLSEAARAGASFSAVSGDPTIASEVIAGGVLTVTAVAVGSVTVTVTDDGGATLPVAVTVSA